MNIKFLSQKALEDLKNRIPQNRAVYLNGAAATLLSGASLEALVDSRVIVDNLPQLIMPDGEQKHDPENARKVFSWLPRLTPVQASDPRLWAYLTHGPYANYAACRWPILEGSKVDDLILQRYFTAGQGLESMARHAIARLWWAGYLTYDVTRLDPFELTDVLLSLQDLQQAFLERAIGRSKKLLGTALEVWKQRLSKNNNIPNKTKSIQAWARLIRLYGAVVVLDSLPQQQLERLLAVKLAIALDEELPDWSESDGNMPTLD